MDGDLAMDGCEGHLAQADMEEFRIKNDPAFDHLARLASKLLKTPVSLVSIIDIENSRQVFAGQKGLQHPWCQRGETPLSHSFCQHVVNADGPLIVSDARQHPLLRDNLAIQDLDVIAYLGVPVRLPDQRAVGALCAIASTPRMWTDQDIDIMMDLSVCANQQVAFQWLRRQNEIADRACSLSEMRYRSIVETQNELICRFGHDLVLTFANRAYANYFEKDDLVGQCFLSFVPEDEHENLRRYFRSLKAGVPQTYEHKVVKPDGSLRWQQWTDLAIADKNGAIIEFQSVGRDITERKELELSVRQQALTDDLVDLPNRKAFDAELKRLWAHAMRDNSQLALIFVDVDHFKAINDTYGHDTGDCYLKEIAGRMQATVRMNDFVARLGGDEFVILAFGSGSHPNFDMLAERLLSNIARPFLCTPDTVIPSVSIGVAVFPFDADTPHELLKAADKALYRAKGAGRGTWRRFGIDGRSHQPQKFLTRDGSVTV